MNFTVLSSAPEDTKASGHRLGLQLRGNEIILVSGDLAAGKTLFIKGMASALDIAVNDVVSPSFVLLNLFFGRHPLYHFDLYRLGSLEGFSETAIDEYIGAGVVAVEWAQYLPPQYFSLPETIAVEIEQTGERRRRLTLRTSLPYITLP